MTVTFFVSVSHSHTNTHTNTHTHTHTHTIKHRRNVDDGDCLWKRRHSPNERTQDQKKTKQTGSRQQAGSSIDRSVVTTAPAAALALTELTVAVVAVAAEAAATRHDTKERKKERKGNR